MKISKKIIVSYIITIATMLVVLNNLKIGTFDEQIQDVEFLIDLINIVLSLIIFINIKTKYNIFILLPICMLFLFLMDIEYQVFYYFNLTNYITKYFILYESITFSWYVVTIIGLLLLLIKFVYSKKESYLLFISFIFVALIIVFFFAPNFIKYLHYPYNSVDLTSHITMFYLCVLLIIALQNKYILLTICGLCFASIANFAMTECYLQNTQNYLFYGEFCWMIGELIISIGFLNIIKFKIYNPDIWFFNSHTIRNKFSFLIFTISIWSFILACIVIKQLSKIENNSFVFIPAIGMFYSMITAVLSVVISKQMEKPFLQMQSTIKSLFDGDNKKDHKNTNLIEFQQLNNFIVESYEYKTTLEKHIVSMATRIAHDIKSPLQIIENLIKNQNNKHILQDVFIKQINKISYISKSLLKENRHIISNGYGLQSLYCIINDLMLDKQIEWNIERSIIDFEYNIPLIIWLDNEQSKIKNVMSNLLNNSFEANNNSTNNIKIIVSLSDKTIVVHIQDFGCGIDKKELNSILDGKSLKINGNGIGLSSAKKFMLSINGEFFIDSNNSEINHGTTIKLIIPHLSFPKQFTTDININSNNIIVVDDNVTILNFWQEYFLFNTKNKNVQYFLNFFSLEAYLSSVQNNHSTTYLLDYKILGEKLTGVCMVKKFNLQNVYLITDYAEDIKLQDEIKLLNLNLVPKTMLEILHKNHAIN